MILHDGRAHLWILAPHPHRRRYKLAFNHYEDALSIRPTLTRRYHDLMVAGISGAGAQVSEMLLKFDGRKYPPASYWLTDKSKDGKRHRVACGG